MFYKLSSWKKEPAWPIFRSPFHLCPTGVHVMIRRMMVAPRGKNRCCNQQKDEKRARQNLWIASNITLSWFTAWLESGFNNNFLLEELLFLSIREIRNNTEPGGNCTKQQVTLLPFARFHPHPSCSVFMSPVPNPGSTLASPGVFIIIIIMF